MAERLLLLGHRGARRAALENSIEAFDLSLQHGCDGFEFDVRLCVDAQPILCHDPKLGGREVARSAARELGAPGLEDVLARYASRAFLDIELKVPGVELILIELLRRYPPQKGYYVSSFLPGVVEALHGADPGLRLGLICRSRQQLAVGRGAPARGLFLERSLCTVAVVESLRRAGKEVFVWTVNRESQMRSFAAMGVQGIISDDTELLAQTLGSGDGGGPGEANEKR